MFGMVMKKFPAFHSWLSMVVVLKCLVSRWEVQNLGASNEMSI